MHFCVSQIAAYFTRPFLSSILVVSPERNLASSYGCGAALFAAFSDQLLIVPVTPLPAPTPMSVTAVEVAEGIALW